ncbi:MAG: cell division protein FtsA [Geminicoccaceae bacterium]|nr:cell division protein FtsA [Geminicoccaceae bacterium]
MSLALSPLRLPGIGVRPASLLAALDIGTSKIACLIAIARPDGGLELVGRGLQAADGIDGGEIVDLEAAEAAIRAVLQEAEDEAGQMVETVIASVGAGRPHSVLLEVERALGGQTVDAECMHAVLERARLEVARQGLAVLHRVALEARVDDGRPVEDPRGLSGSRLRVLVHLVVARREPLQRVLRVLERCHLEVRALVAAPFAAGLGCLFPDERERGCLVVDMGAQATHVAHFTADKLAWIDRIDLGGERITHDIAWGLEIDRKLAERVKSLYGAVVWRACDDHVRIRLEPGDGFDPPTGEVPRTRLTTIVRARAEEILEAVASRLRERGAILRARPPRSIVLTGGSAQLEGMDELAREIFGLPARIGRPRPAAVALRTDQDPALASALGALLVQTAEPGDESPLASDGRRGVGERLGRLRAWLKSNF